MPKSKTLFYCTECGYESAKWFGQCPACKKMNTMEEAPERKTVSGRALSPFSARSAVSLSKVNYEKNQRIPTGSGELDRVLGGGIVKGSFILLGGDPGIGKSTILLQVSKNLAEVKTKVLYVSGEESLPQIKMRADRIGTFPDSFLLLAETDMDAIEEVVAKEKPEVLIIDSIQTMMTEEGTGTPGSVSQIREATARFLRMAKEWNIAVFIIGHVTKEGTVAGPRMLEHMVDTVLYFEGERSESYRLIRAVKNRFGATNEVGVFQMTGKGLEEVPDASKFMLSGRPIDASGSAVTCILEGTRPMLLELQALVMKTSFGLPRRTAVGIDYNKLNLLLAIMEKRAGVSLSSYDVYVNVTGGIKISDPAMDLSIVMAIASSLADLPISEDTIGFGEVGLTGELRGVPQVVSRVKEASKLGYQKILIPDANKKSIPKELQSLCMPVKSIRQAISLLKFEKK